MKKMYRQWLGIAALLCHITMQAAGNKAVVTGTVKDTQGNPIACRSNRLGAISPTSPL